MSKKNEESSSEIPDMHKEIAHTALNEFNKGNYAAASMYLGKIQQCRPKDIKAQMNKAVVEFYRSGLKKTNLFRKTLLDICSQAGIKIDNCSHGCMEASVLRLNYCLVLFYSQEYSDATVILANMHQSLDSLDEKLGICISLLLAECYLKMNQPSNAYRIVSDTESFYLPPPHQPEKQNESSRELNRSSSGQSMPSQNMPSSSESISGGSETKDSADQELLRTKLLILRVRSNLQIRLQRQLKKDLKYLNSVPGNQQNLTLSMIKALLEYIKNCYKKSYKFISQCPNMNSLNYSPRGSVSCQNNIGVLYFAMGKPTMAISFLKNSITAMQNENEKNTENDSQCLYSCPTAELVSVNYNVALALLTNNQPVQAFDYLLLVVKCHPSNARIWLRLAECCIGAHKLSVKHEQKSLRDSIRFLYTTADGRKVISICGDIDNHDKNLEEQQHITDAALPIPTLEFARICLRNALYLIPEDISLDVPEDQENSNFAYAAPPSVPLRGWQVMQIKLASLACSAYVCLCLGDFSVSLNHAQTLISLLQKAHKFESDYKFLGYMYCGEALVKLGRISEAISFFDPLQVGEMNLPQAQEAPEIISDRIDVNPYASIGGSIILRYNLAAANAIRGQFHIASNLLRKISNEIKDWPPQFYMLSLYINLQLGNMDAVENIIRKHCY